ncbi:hypothetical protein EUTSA_v10017550mg [Eutrema salsugineum]|uniref:F-box domain-containing protein n=1 Tax=Eutrema salsugineum TaxID=72664 RepID=V4MF89_EUTSA|nr:hypothetical protein EUTSA_v10017550mg [Eutrema salsugineum]
MLKRHRPCVELLPHDVEGLNLERLAVKSLLRFKSVSKKWKSTIDSQRFQEKQLIRRMQSRDPDLHCVSTTDIAKARITVTTTIFRTLKLPFMNTYVCYGSCDGLVGLHCIFSISWYVVPTSPYRILAYQRPVYLDGSFYCLTEFISKTPFPHLPDHRNVTMCVLDNRLCVSQIFWPTQVIWSFDYSGGNKTWTKMF